MADARRHVMAQLVAVCGEATRNGLDGFRAIREAFPSVPASVAGEAFALADMADVEDSWQSVERTIDGEIIRRALAAPADGGG